MGMPANVNLNAFTQRRYAEGGQFARASHPTSVDFVLEQARKYPGQVTLVAIGPLPNVGAMIDKDPAAFRMLKRVVIMGGSIRTMTDPYGVARADRAASGMEHQERHRLGAETVQVRRAAAGAAAGFHRQSQAA